MTKPYPFQVETAQQIHQLGGRALVAHEMGLGKSLITLLYAQANPQARPMVIVCPASVKWNWQRECSIHLGWNAEVLEGTKPQLFRLGMTKHNITIVNYDILSHWIDFLKALKPQLVIGDEAQYIKDPKTRRNRAFRELCQGVPYVIGLSGTPLVNRPVELFPILNLLRPDLFPNFWRYANRYCGPRRLPWGMDFSGASNLSELHTTLVNGDGQAPGVMLRKLKKEVLDQLPTKRRIVFPVGMENRKEYNHARDHFLDWLGKQSPGKLSKAASAEKLVQLSALRQLVAKLKLPEVMEWIDTFLEQTDEKLILFAIHRKTIRALHERYKESVHIDGSITGKTRQKTFDQFLKNKHTRILIGQIKAAGVGWSAKGVSTVAFVELPWTPGDLTQAEDRVHGIGRGAKGVRSTIYYLVARETVDEKLLKILQQKNRTLNRTLDGGANRGDNLNIWDKLCDQLKRERQG